MNYGFDKEDAQFQINLLASMMSKPEEASWTIAQNMCPIPRRRKERGSEDAVG